MVIPRGEDPISLDVMNPDATTGGKHEEFPKVEPGGRRRGLGRSRAGAAGRLRGPARRSVRSRRRAPPSSRRPAVLGVPAPTVDPATLVGQEVASFDLGLNATGTVIAVEPGPVETVVAERLRSTIDSDHRLVDELDQGRGRPGRRERRRSASRRPPRPAGRDPRSRRAQGDDHRQAARRGRRSSRRTAQVQLDGLAGLGVDGPDARRAGSTLTLDEAVPVETPEPSASP